ncbi:hypothetical protein [Paraburkholderia susongensis]|uniref:Uncharacterized protein n=1 Tax=Paraburkholderia susongensis TaxID=1515439 RepID=A0A1X7LQI9_9BURK|nr:hypothetical protein [Paraburkholderia susongensis]SMG56161.1 hypothetical protein SAMN06265784_10848 [Paraburkholderia susongensis]
MRSRSTLPALGPRVQPGQRVASEISSAIVAVKSASERGRAESIRDVVDAYRRLYGSVQRFVIMLSGGQLSFKAIGTSGSHSLNQLLSILAEQARTTAFARLRELKTTIEEARLAEHLRDAIFSDAFSNDLPALRKVVAELERLDTAMVGLCVGHVLEQHVRPAGEMVRPVARPAGQHQRAAVRRVRTARTAAVVPEPLNPRAEPALAHPAD